MTDTKIKNVIICGLGAVGLTYAYKLKDICNLKILADKARVEKYLKNPPLFNQQTVTLEYITPQEPSFNADLIIISTKSSGLNSAISYIKNFVGENTIIISLLNGISSEEEISSVYGENKVIPAYFIGHSAVREKNSVSQDGIGKIVFGGENSDKVIRLKEFFDKNNIDYEISKDINYSLWLKLAINVYLNQSSAILNMTMGEMKRNPQFLPLAKALIQEVKNIAQACQIQNLEHFEEEALSALDLMSENGKSSMLQDILAHRKTEVDIFAGEIIKRGKKLGIETPYNKTIYDLIKIIELK
jgi:2-dehydropantoate 2-reductase